MPGNVAARISQERWLGGRNGLFEARARSGRWVVAGTVAGVWRLSLWCLLAALLVMALSDSTYTYLTEVANYTSGDPIDVGWIAAYLGIALAALSSRLADVVAPVLAPSGERSQPSLASLVSPLLPVLVALSVTAVEIRLGDHLDEVSWLMALALIVLVLVRQALAVFELLAPSRQAHEGWMDRLTRSVLDVAGDRDHADRQPVAMADHDASAQQSGGGGGSASVSHSPEVRWLRPAGQRYVPPPASKSAASERTERTHAVIVAVLTLDDHATCSPRARVLFRRRGT
jgi:hypothetical protein